MPNTQSESPLKGQVALVTGGTSGIGLAAAQQIARMGAQVIVTGHNPKHAEDARRTLERSAPDTQIEVILGDLSLQTEVRGLAERIARDHDRLDILLDNAGRFNLRRRETTDGFEETFAVNHLAPFALTLLLLPLFNRAEHPRIVVTSSTAHRSGRIHFDDLMLERGFNGWKAYAQSKLANVMFTYELARRLEGRPISINAYHPGFVATNFAKNSALITPILGVIYQVLARPPDEAAKTAVMLVAQPREVTGSGRYFVDGRAVRTSRLSYDKSQWTRLWEASVDLTGIDCAEC